MKYCIVTLIILFSVNFNFAQTPPLVSAFDSLQPNRDAVPDLVSKMKDHTKKCRELDNNSNFRALRTCLDNHLKVRNALIETMAPIYLVVSGTEDEAIKSGFTKDEYEELAGWLKSWWKQILRDIVNTKPSLEAMELRAQS